MTESQPIVPPAANDSGDGARRAWFVAAAVLAIVAAGVVAFIVTQDDDQDARVSSTDVTTMVDPGAPTTVAVTVGDTVGVTVDVEATVDASAPTLTSDTVPATTLDAIETTSTAPASTTLPPSTSTTPGDAVSTPIVAITADGDAVYFPIGSTEPVLLFDGPDLDAAPEEGPGPNVVDVVAVTPDATTAFVGTCCEPINGAVLRTTPPALATYEQPPLAGYGPAVSPNGALLATAQIPGPADPVRIVDIATETQLPVISNGELNAFSGFDSMWLDDERVVVLGTEFISDQNQWVAYPATVDDGTVEVQLPIVIAPAENTGLGTWNFAGRLGGDQFAVHRQGDSGVLAVSFSASAGPAPAGDVGAPALRIWLDPGLQTIYVGDDAVLHVGDETLAGSFTWARR